MKWYAAPILWVARLRVEFTGALERQGNYLIVSNHLSYIDVLAIARRYPSVFITSMEVYQDPLLGIICRAAGCVFVERRSRSLLQDEIATIADALKDGFDVVLFPEGTTTAGDKILPFRKSLMEAATLAGVNILPLCLNYRSVNGQPVSENTKNAVFYYGDDTFLPNLMRVLDLRDIHLEISSLPPVPVNDGACRKRLAEEAREKIALHFVPIPQV